MRQTVVDGVPVVVTPAPGPVQATLYFRVGQADETAATRGVTHLVEHLALHGLGPFDHRSNGGTGQTVTQFETTGTPDEVATFLTGVCRSLSALRLGRLDVERRVLRTEEAAREADLETVSARWRHGARNYGLISYAEFGVGTLTADAVDAWATSHFTRDNAVLAITGELPAGLTLPLPSGVRRPMPAASAILPVTPAYFPGPGGWLGVTSMVDRGTPASLYARLLHRALMRSLRTEAGLSYTTAARYRVGSAGRAEITAHADADAGHVEEAVDLFVRTLQSGDWIDEAELARAVQDARTAMAEPSFAAGATRRWAQDILCGLPPRTREDIAAGLKAVSLADVAEVARACWANALLMLPGVRAERYGCERAPMSSRAVPPGRRFAARDGGRAYLVVGKDGVGLADEGRYATVRYTDCVLLVRHTDGGRLVLGADGLGVPLEPEVFAVDAATLASVDAAVNPAVIVDRERDANDIPRPDRARRRDRRIRAAKVALHRFWHSRVAFPAATLTVMAFVLVALCAGSTGSGTGVLRVLVALGGLLAFLGGLLVWRHHRYAHW
ncbi:M16 family metallopeptidase [Hamadaea tsunoensis]|uniref:M16 family metallopeptidase n=1 Tax=Hamadaea tsunoensis TaxID=53368 RepID=UPI0007E8D3AC|nr:insulinase family protein [Hamadaea tsunoensis]